MVGLVGCGFGHLPHTVAPQAPRLFLCPAATIQTMHVSDPSSTWLVSLLGLICLCVIAGCDDDQPHKTMQGPVGIVETNPTGYGQLGVFLVKGSEDSCTVEMVRPGSPAQQAGMMPGDVIREIDGWQITTHGDLIAVLKKTKPRDRIHVTFIRNGEAITRKIELISANEVVLFEQLEKAGKKKP